MDPLKKLSRPLLSIIAGYAKEENPNYSEGFDLMMLNRSESPSTGRKDIDLFLSAIEQGCVKTVAHMLQRERYPMDPAEIIFHNFALSTEHHHTTPLLHALRHRQFDIVALLIKDYKDQIKKTINQCFQTKQILFGSGSVGQPWVDFGTALSYAIEACHLPTILNLRDLGAETPPAYCLDSLKRLLKTSQPAKIKRPIVTMLMNHGDIQIDNENLSLSEIERLREILDPGFAKSKVVAKPR